MIKFLKIKGLTNLKQHAFNLYDHSYLNLSNNMMNFSSILDSQDFKEFNKVLNIYFKLVCNKLSNFIENKIQNKIISEVQIQNISFAIFLSALVLFFLFYWYPTVNGMNSAVKRIFFNN